MAGGCKNIVLMTCGWLRQHIRQLIEISGERVGLPFGKTGSYVTLSGTLNWLWYKDTLLNR